MSAKSARKHHVVPTDRDNPEWTKDDFAKARPAAEVLPAEALAAFGKPRGRPKSDAPRSL